jgi:succinoglycan biosynthesis protein ExoM
VVQASPNGSRRGGHGAAHRLVRGLRLPKQGIELLNMAVKISVCIPTYRREDRLRALLEDLIGQDLPPFDVVVVDNDAAGSARRTVDEIRDLGCPFLLTYAIQPERSIPLTRNMTVRLAAGEWLAFVDDDERAPREWLRRLLDCAVAYSADGVLAPVEPHVPDSAPEWIRSGNFYDWPRIATGAPVPRKNLRFGNLLLRGSTVRNLPGPFDPDFALSAGEDVDMLVRLVKQGAKLVWCDEAPVWEPVEPKRLSLGWLLLRGYSGGQAFGRIQLAGGLGRVSLPMRVTLPIRWTIQLLAALLVAAALWPVTRHRAVAWLIKAWANAGKLTALAGRRYRAYA